MRRFGCWTFWVGSGFLAVLLFTLYAALPRQVLESGIYDGNVKSSLMLRYMDAVQRRMKDKGWTSAQLQAIRVRDAEIVWITTDGFIEFVWVFSTVGCATIFSFTGFQVI